jgi:hypothetical protein
MDAIVSGFARDQVVGRVRRFCLLDARESCATIRALPEKCDAV